MIDPNDNAFPFDDKGPHYGLSKREYFAAMAMQGICANSIPGSHHMSQATAMDAVDYADALIAELNKEKKP